MSNSARPSLTSTATTSSPSLFTEADDSPTSVQRGQSPSARSTGSSATPVTMELALTELRTTIQEAELYRQNQQQHPQHLKSHILALQEDADMLAVLQTTDDAVRLQATQTIFEARRLKRHLERAVIDIEIEQGKTDSLVKNKATEEKVSGLKLTPLKLPEFSGNVAQFHVFRSFFEENILQNSSLTDTAKWLRLKESLSGAAAELVSEIPQTPHTLQVAWKLLKDVYGGDDKPIVELYDRLQRLSPATNQTAALRLTHSKLEGILLSLEHLGHDVEENQFIRWVVLSKYPPELMYQVPQKRDTPLGKLRTAIADVIAVRENADYQRAETSTTEQKWKGARPPVPLPRTAVAGTAQTDVPAAGRAQIFRPRNCAFCGNDHWNDSCTTYATIAARKARIVNKCTKCLQPAHEPARCNNTKRCFHCDSYDHNRALCPVKFGGETEKTVATLAVIDDVPQKVGCFLTFLAQAQVRNAARRCDVRVVVDTAGGATLMRRAAVEALGLACSKKNKITYTGLNGAHLTEGHQMDSLVQLLVGERIVVTMQPAVVESIVQDVPTVDVEQFKRTNPAFASYDIPPAGDGRPIDVLLGSDVMVDLLLPERITYVNADMLLVPTKAGWLILGRQKESKIKVCHATTLTFLQNPLKLISDLELVGLAQLHSSDIDDEQAAIHQFYETVRFVDGRYSISWPWRVTPPNLDTNYGLALGRLRTLYKRLQATPHLLRDYNTIIQNQEADGVIERIPATSTATQIHYVPHHPVLQPEKSTSIRPVYDGAATAGPRKLSLNDNILKGTKWLNDLVATLIRFRRFRVAVTADIARAFHQISINNEDRDVVRFIWLKDPAKPPIDSNLQIYRFTRVAFGIVASPFILHAVIQYHASKQKKCEQLDMIPNDLYADNLVTAVADSVDPCQFYGYAKAFFSSMSMNLTKWTSNDEKFRKALPEDDRLEGVVQPLLGLRWNTQADTIALKAPKIHHEKQPTRRTVAKEMASFFDPLGWIIPVTLLAKLYFRRIWTKTEKWDQPLQEEDKIEWLQILSKLGETNLLEFPRQFADLSWKSVQIHTFVDASTQAYAVVTYARICTEKKTQVAILAARNRLAPKKQLTVPKLELTALILGCRFTEFVRQNLHLDSEIPTYVWSDSKCVLAWVEQKRLLPPVVQKCIQEVMKYNITNFRYVPSQLNYADVATRGATIAELVNMKWWSGPSWLAVESEWPIIEKLPPSEIEKNVLAFRTEICNRETTIAEKDATGIATLDIQSFSSLTKLLKMTALCAVAVKKLLKNAQELAIEDSIDLQAARRRWLKWDQDRVYRLKNEEKAGRIFNLKNVSVFRDQHQLIRCQTRLMNTFTDLETSNPVLLAKDSTLTKLIVLQIHTSNYHAGTSHTLAVLRKEFWLPHGRRQISKIIFNDCAACRKNLAKTYPTPPPLPLPEFRILRTQKPFQVIGLDIFGPMITRVQPGKNQLKQKIWGIIFTCAVIRAIHIEILEDMSTQEISYAFRRFVARRGVPYKIVSDNAPQFHELDDCFVDLWKTAAKNPAISNYLAEKRIEWKFITDTAPWMGGFYERMIKIIKNSLEFTYGDKILLKRQLCTTLVEIEAIVNSRPISYVDRELESPIVTPNDFLSATFTSIPINQHDQITDTHVAKLWKSSQQYLDQFWRHWAKQYVLLLRDRHDKLQTTTKHAKQCPQKGDLVVMAELTKKRSQWQMAVVERLIRSQDGEVRSVQVRVPNGARLIRPIVTLAPLRLQMDLPAVTDAQLNKKRNAITIWPPEGATQERADLSQSVSNTDRAANQRRDEDEEGERRYRESEAGSEGGGVVPYHSNGLENELGPTAAELALREASIEAAENSSSLECREEHETYGTAARERQDRSAGRAGSSNL